MRQEAEQPPQTSLARYQQPCCKNRRVRGSVLPAIIHCVPESASKRIKVCIYLMSVVVSILMLEF